MELSLPVKYLYTAVFLLDLSEPDISSTIIYVMIMQTDSSPVPVQICRSHRVPERRRQLLPPEDVLRHQPVHVVFPQQHHGPRVIGPRCTRHEGQLPEAHYPHGRVHGKP